MEAAVGMEVAVAMEVAAAVVVEAAVVEAAVVAVGANLSAIPFVQSIQIFRGVDMPDYNLSSTMNDERQLTINSSGGGGE
jgi:hypothetical protein